MKPSRNDPCPCGSGKKYKQCCLKTEQSQPEDDFLWRRIRRAIEGSPPQLLSFGSSHFGPEALLEAWDEFMPPWDEGHVEPFTSDTPHMTIFMPWFFMIGCQRHSKPLSSVKRWTDAPWRVLIWTRKANNLIHYACATWNNAA